MDGLFARDGMTFSFWLVIYLFVCLLGLAQLMIMTLHAYENGRFARRRISKPRDDAPQGRVALLAPCKGIDVGLEDNLRPLLEQDYDDYEVHFIVETTSDPACDTIRHLMKEYPHVESRLVVAGRSGETGQKIHNLLAAITGLSDDVETLAFVDSDARPKPHWLAMLVSRLDRDGVGATTGYRCLVPMHATFANELLYSINSFVVAIFGGGGRHPIWGGSWAIRREVFQSIGLADAWRGTLSDDLVAAYVLHDAGLRVEFEPGCVVASPLNYSASQMIEFMRRQYKIGRFYAPFWWRVSLVTSTIATGAFWGSAAIAVAGLTAGAAWTPLPLTMCLLLYAATALRNALRQSIVKTLLPDCEADLRGARRFDIWAGPLVGLVNWLGLCSSVFGNQVTWRDVVYQILPGGKIRLIGRRSEPDGAMRIDQIDGPPAKGSSDPAQSSDHPNHDPANAEA